MMTVSSLSIQAGWRNAHVSTRLPRLPLRIPLFRLLGPAFAVSIGYVDPGNFATDLGAGTFGYRLLWVVGLANVVAIVLQLAVSDLTLASGEEFGALIARRWKRYSCVAWLTFQGAAIATDLAEFSGIVLGTQLLFRWSLVESVAAGLLIVASVMLATGKRTKVFEYAMIVALGAICIACIYQIPFVHPAWHAVVFGALIPHLPNTQALVMAVGIIGATVMPHNLFLHSALVRRSMGSGGPPTTANPSHRRFFRSETLVALNVAAVVNAAILIVGAAVNSGGSFHHAFAVLQPLGGILGTAFGGALLLSGIAASLTATVSGDYIFRSLAPLRVTPVVRRAVTILPAAAVIAAGVSIPGILVWSQVVLALILPLALVPLVVLLREHRRGALLTALASLLCVTFDVVMIVQLLHSS
jgi:manganese transport protein